MKIICSQCFKKLYEDNHPPRKTYYGYCEKCLKIIEEKKEKKKEKPFPEGLITP